MHRITILLPVVCALAGLAAAQAQSTQTEAKEEAPQRKRCSDCERIEVDSPLSKDVSLQAVLLPPSVCRRVFGHEIANKYAAIQLIVSNRNREASMMLHSVYLDYSGWLLSGSPRNLRSGADENGRAPWEAATKRDQVASVEYRVARGQLLDAQPWSARNIVRRSLQVAGSVASAFIFNVDDQSLTQGITAANGLAAPMLDYFWPDATIGQMNRISDIGFQVNKVIPKESGDIVVAFFPLDRFMTKAIKSIYLKQPAVLFAPYAMITDPTVERAFEPLLKDVVPAEPGSSLSARLVRAYLIRTRMSELKAQEKVERKKDPIRQLTSDEDLLKKAAAELGGSKGDDVKKYLPLLALLDRASLNNIRLVVGGIMVVDADSIPAHIDDVLLDAGNQTADTWLQPGEKKGTIRGRFLPGNELRIADAAKLHIETLETVKEGSNDKELRFHFTLKSPLASGTKLEFHLSRKDQNGRTLESNPFTLEVSWQPVSAPVVKKATRDGDTLTIEGERFYEINGKPPALTLHPTGNPDAKNVPVSAQLVTTDPSKLVIDLKALKLPAACWTPLVSTTAGAATNAPDVKPFLQAPSRQITSAKKSADGKTVEVVGVDLVDIEACGAKLEVQYAPTSDTNKAKPVANLQRISSTKLAFDMPNPPTTKWTVLILAGKDVVAKEEIQ